MKTVYKIFPILFIFCCSVLPFSDVHAQVWVPVGNIGFSDSVVGNTSIAIDRSGTPYVVYIDWGNGYKATVMKYNGSSWITVGSAGFSAGNASYTSIAIDSSGTPYVVYSDYSAVDSYTFKATVMKYNGSSWVIVGSAGFSSGGAYSTSIAIDGSGTPYVAYEDSVDSQKATVMKYNGSNWVNVGSPGFSAGAVRGTAIAIDSSGMPYVVYEDLSTAYYGSTVMKYNRSSWVNIGNTGFSAGWVQYTSIAIENGVPYVIYADGGNEEKSTVMKYDGSSWVPVGNPGCSAGGAASTSIAIDNSDTPYAVYRDSANTYKATVMKYSGTGWVNVGSAGLSAGEVNYTSIAIDKNEVPYVVYEDFANGGKATVMKLDTSIHTAVTKITNSTSLTLTVYPNPTHNSFTLNISSPSNEDATIIITNTLGEKVKELTTTTNINTEVQLDSPPGLYFISAITKNGTVAGKVVVE